MKNKINQKTGVSVLGNARFTMIQAYNRHSGQVRGKEGLNRKIS